MTGKTQEMRKKKKVFAVSKKEKSEPPRKLMWFGVILLAVACYQLCLHFAEPRLLPIKHIKLSGECERIDEQAIKAHTMHYVRGFFSTDVMRLKRKLLKVPFVQDVSVKRVWPDTLLVTLEEQRFVAVWGENAMVSSKGEVSSLPEIDEKLPVFKGPDGQAALMVQQYNEIAKLIEPLHLTIKELNLNNRRSWQMQLSNNIKVIMGRKDLGEKVETLKTVYPRLKKHHGENIETIDLRYPNGICVHPK